ncbi:1-deoxy-D-xylulose-5-phosphate reductoisomerase [Porphyromonas sp.]|uniref:1-deoxy-D-xylulose-5-phosphate reductoisomerase n=1 Tax=Porphyromonas sp. TaxID=1924944 RepID=UPI0026DB0371|nr:1-deoxy-D-xylulose-5-phosphate reductoisomerase [Porphyromonas sp.]MDO4695496.1 1-deoxy-D-xylulose-5-phosphate reductoisomerase [Porphyromonas sp.]MDO4770263.1 1-deoxy-D-xylulose-5-phosphate reductoisomerase [Porphyromonas sp.]
MTPKKVTILGSTGSIGTQALDVISKHRDILSVYALVCHSNVDLLIRQAKEFKPQMVAIASEMQYKYLKKELAGESIEILVGEEAVCDIAGSYEADTVLTAMVGFAGLAPTIHAMETGRTIALANKETLVVAGELIMQLSRQKMSPIIPVDSEHSAIFQCLYGDKSDAVSRIYLTASGGPFVDFTTEELQRVTPQQALNHPKWDMGKKVSIDSATLMNKGLEMIEAKWLFDVSPKDIEIAIHRQSIIHSMVGYRDGSVKAQLSMPDMRLPIAYGLLFPNRLDIDLPLPSLSDLCNLTFEVPRRDAFPCLDLAFEAIEMGGTAPCVMNAANEIAVERFLSGGIGFTDIPRLIRDTMDNMGSRNISGVVQLRDIDAEARQRSRAWTRNR